VRIRPCLALADERDWGCVALAEDGVNVLQEWARPGAAVIGILPNAAVERFAACLPGVSPKP